MKAELKEVSDSLVEPNGIPEPLEAVDESAHVDGLREGKLTVHG